MSAALEPDTIDPTDELDTPSTADVATDGEDTELNGPELLAALSADEDDDAPAAQAQLQALSPAVAQDPHAQALAVHGQGQQRGAGGLPGSLAVRHTPGCLRLRPSPRA